MECRFTYVYMQTGGPNRELLLHHAPWYFVILFSIAPCSMVFRHTFFYQIGMRDHMDAGDDQTGMRDHIWRFSSLRTGEGHTDRRKTV